MIVFGGALALALAALFYHRFTEDGMDSGPRTGGSVVAVEVAPLETGAIRDLRTFTGSLSSRSNFDVVAKVGGRLSRLAVDIGDVVERGDVIARIDDEEFLQDVAQAEAELEVARANLEEARSSLELAERERDRVEALRERRVVSMSDLEASEAAVQAERSRVRVAEATILQRDAGLRAARLRLSYTEVDARWEGEGDIRVVGERYVEEGTTLAPGDRIISLVDLQRLRAVIQVTERDYERIRIDQPGLVATDSLTGETFDARVMRRAPQFRETSRQARVELDVSNPDERLMPGQFVRVRMELDRAENAVIAPRSALVRREGEQGLFVIEGGEDGETARFYTVRPGFIEGQLVQILEPHLEGDVVVLGQDQLTDGVRVNIVGRREPRESGDPGLTQVEIEERAEVR